MDRFRKISSLDRSLAMMHFPRFEQLHDPATMRVVGFNRFDSLDGIATAKRQERITAPFGPLFETT